MRHRLPPLNALKSFEAAARHESFTKAARELNVTQGAVSHQVKALEERLGLRLFQRERQRLLITGAGRQYLEVVRDAFDRISMGTERLLEQQQNGPLVISTSPNFAAKWLMHRLPSFARSHPDVDLHISATLQHIDFARDDADLAIRHGDGRWPGLSVTKLCDEEIFPVCSPRLLEGRKGLRNAEDLARHTLIHLNDHEDWAQWLKAVGVTGIDASRGPLFSERSMAIDAAIEGQGVALARTALAAWDLLNGRLARPLPHALPADYAYWIVCPRSSADLPRIANLRNWLLDQSADDARRLREAGPGANEPIGRNSRRARS